jgi:hypothetical protein
MEEEEGKNHQDYKGFTKDKQKRVTICTTITSIIDLNNFQVAFEFKYKEKKTVYDVIYAWASKEQNESRLEIFTKQIVIESNNNKVEFDIDAFSLVTEKGIELKISQVSNLERTESIGVKILDETDTDNFIVSPNISMKDLRLLVSLYCAKHARNIGLSSTYHVYDDNDIISASGALQDEFIIAFWVQLCSKRKMIS